MENTKVAALICTAKRPKAFAGLIESFTKLNIPASVTFTICVADNNPESQEQGYIKEAFTGTGLDFVSAHESVPGYSSARNKSLELGLASNADFFLVTDDDLKVDPDWVVEHLRGFEKYGSNINCALQVGTKNSRKDGQIIENVAKRVGTSNLGFRRNVIDPDAMAIKFDMRFNEKGGEDTQFLVDAKHAGAKIVWVPKAIVRKNEPDWKLDPCGAYQSALNLAEIRRVKHNNEMIYALREGKVSGILKRVGKTVPDGLSWIVLTIIAKPVQLYNLPRGLKLKAGAYRNYCKMAGTFSGIFGEEKSRIEARRNDVA